MNGDGMAETSECVGDSTPGPASAAFKSFCQVVAAAVADPRFPIHPSSTVAEQVNRLSAILSSIFVKGACLCAHG